MIPELGHFALVLALMMAVATMVVPLWGSWRGHYAMMRMAPGLASITLARPTCSINNDRGMTRLSCHQKCRHR